VEKAISSFRSALEEQTRERTPLEWAIVQQNLGAALSWLGQQEGKPERLEGAIEAYRSALELFRETSATHFVRLAEQSIAKTQVLIESLSHSK
jgi:tetratricopeptide (TPR) repeat protein